MASAKEVRDSVVNDWKESIQNTNGVLRVAIENAVKQSQQSNAERIEALEKEVNDLKQPSPHNTFVPESTGPVNDYDDTGFM